MRQIDADALTDEIMERYCKECDKRKGIKSGKYRIIYEVGDAPCRACPIDDMKDELDNAPTIEPERKWIPVSERMPEEKRRYLVYYTLNGTDRSIRTAMFYPGGWIEWDVDGIPGIARVLAWMPLPEPYREEDR